jgi:hypothetical protein
VALDTVSPVRYSFKEYGEETMPTPPSRNQPMSAEAQAKRAAQRVAIAELLDSPGWEFTLKSATAILHQNHKLLRMRDTGVEETQAARGALDAIMTLLKVIYTCAEQEVPPDLKPFYD